MYSKCVAINFVEGVATTPDSGYFNSTGIVAKVTSAASAVPFGTTIPYSTAMAIGAAFTSTGYQNATITFAAMKTVTSSTAAQTSKSVSGAVSGLKSYGAPELWTLLATILGAWIL